MSTYASAQDYAAQQALLLARIKLYEVPFELAVRTVLAQQTERIFTQGRRSDGGRIGAYDTERELYVNPKLSPRATAAKGPGFSLQGLLPTRGKPSTEWQTPSDEAPEGEHIFTGRTAWRGGPGTKAGDPHKTTYVRNYKDFRNRIGRRVDTVDLVLSGDLRLDFVTAQLQGRAVTSGEGSLEFVVKFKRARNADKRDGLEAKYGRIFALTTAERSLYFKTLVEELRAAVRDLRP